MEILIVTPAPAGSLRGNRVTAERWATHLGELGHSVAIAERFCGQRCELLIALHARRSAAAVEAFRAAHPARPIVVVLTGTDLYADLPDDPGAARSVELATTLVGLNPLAAERLEPHLRPRVRTVVQSVDLRGVEVTPTKGFQICVVGHLRAVKDPFLIAEAVANLPENSDIHVVHLGMALESELERRAEALNRDQPRYSWRGQVDRDEALSVLASSRIHVLTSKMEGGANALCEAIALGVPTLATRIDGSVGLLGDDYPGFFPVAFTAAASMSPPSRKGMPQHAWPLGTTTSTPQCSNTCPRRRAWRCHPRPEHHPRRSPAADPALRGPTARGRPALAARAGGPRVDGQGLHEPRDRR